MYHIEYRRSALKEIKRLDKPARKEMVSHIERCAEDPYRKGKPLHGGLSGYFTYDFTYQKVSYRFIYIIHQQHQTMVVALAGTRENIYNNMLTRKL